MEDKSSSATETVSHVALTLDAVGVSTCSDCAGAGIVALKRQNRVDSALFILQNETLVTLSTYRIELGTFLTVFDTRYELFATNIHGALSLLGFRNTLSGSNDGEVEVTLAFAARLSCRRTAVCTAADSARDQLWVHRLCDINSKTSDFGVGTHASVSAAIQYESLHASSAGLIVARTPLAVFGSTRLQL